MIMLIGPFSLLFFAIASLIIYMAGFYFAFKNKLGILGFLTILFFPLIGSLGIIFYSLNEKSMTDQKI